MADSTTQATSSSASSTAVAALLEARPPATDRFTYLTLIEEHLSPDVLPTLHDVLQDAPLTQEIGWDLVDMLVPLLPASEACLDDVARLGNPREVILKVLEVLEQLKSSRGRGPRTGFGEDGEDDLGEDEEAEEEEAGEAAAVGNDAEEDPTSAERTTQTFVVLLGMLGVLHRRIKTKYPSRFLESTLRTILAAYRPDRPAMTTAVLGLVRSLAARRRPPPPMRRSDSQLGGLALAKQISHGSATGESPATPTDAGTGPRGNLVRTDSAIGKVANDEGQPDDTAVGVPDPEAEDQVEPSEPAIQQRLLQSFVTCILESYVNANEVAWAARLIEHYRPNKLVPGRPTELHNFREDVDKIARDQAVSQLAALALDLGLKNSDSLVQSICKGPIRRNPLASFDVAAGDVSSIPLSTGGVICLLTYWVFSADVFKADAPTPNLRIFPDHYAILEAFFEDNAAAQIARTPGTVEAIVALGLWLDHHGLYSSSNDKFGISTTDFMPYHHLLTLCAVFHPSLVVRNAATELAGAVLHANPDAEDRLKILQDLLENCMFASLKACAVTWLREEILAATSTNDDKEKTEAGPPSLFAGSDAVEQLQYAIFPDLQALQDTALAAQAGGEETEETALLEYWLQNAPFLLQAANFAYFLFASDKYRVTVVPPGMGPAIEQRYVEPLLQAAARLRNLLGDDEGGKAATGEEEKAAAVSGAGELQHIVLDLDLLSSRLGSLKLS